MTHRCTLGARRRAARLALRPASRSARRGRRQPSLARIAIPACLVLAAAPLAAQAQGQASYSLSADASTSFLAALPGFNPAEPGALLLSSLRVDLLHRFEAGSWGAVLNHRLDLALGSGGLDLAPAPGSGGLASAEPAVSGAIYEAYVRLESEAGAQAIFGKRRLPLGLGTAFAPGDLLNPRSGFWDQKTGFHGLSLIYAPSLSYSLRASASLDGNLAASEAARDLAAAQAALAPWPADPQLPAAAAAAQAAYLDALHGASGAADPTLLSYAAQAEFQLGSLLLSASGVYQARRIARPSLGLSLDLAGLILQAEGALEFEGTMAGYAAAGARYTVAADAFDLTVSVDADYGGSGGLLAADWYLLSQLILVAPDRFQALARALVALEEPSALVAAAFTLFPAEGLDIELNASFGLGADGTEFSGAALSGSGAPLAARSALGLAARIHF